MSMAFTIFPGIAEVAGGRLRRRPGRPWGAAGAGRGRWSWL